MLSTIMKFTTVALIHLLCVHLTNCDLHKSRGHDYLNLRSQTLYHVCNLLSTQQIFVQLTYVEIVEFSILHLEEIKTDIERA